MKIINTFMLMLLLLTSCQRCENIITLSGLYPKKFESEIHGDKIKLFVLKNENNMEVCITNFGARIVSIMVPDKDGIMRDVVLGFDSIEDYIKYPTDFGATIGRYANRIANGRFVLDKKEYQLPLNNLGHCLHGGPKGFQYRVFEAKQINDKELQLKYISKDGEEGFPGNLECIVSMVLRNDNAIDIKYQAYTDKATIVNMTNHSYFNLDGNPRLDNSSYLLQINSDSFTPIDNSFITTGDILPVDNTPFDFREARILGNILSMENEQIKNGRGIDHNWILNTNGNIENPCARLKSEKTGIILDVYTTEPGLQVYTGNFLDGTIIGKKGIVYNFRTSVCLETQKYPDTPNKLDWPSSILRPGETYSSRCIYKFSVESN